MQLQQQLDQAIESREERLRRLDRDDQKEALRKEIEVINERAKEEIDKLNQEQKTTEEAYRERMKDFNLRIEAEQFLMTQSAEQILAFMAEYAPEYDALGKTLGEKLLEGFAEKVDNIADFFKDWNDAFNKIQENLAADMLAAGDAFYAAYKDKLRIEAEITQEVVESAIQVALSNARENGALPPPTITQTVNFNQPIESAGDAAARLARLNEDLVTLLFG